MSDVYAMREYRGLLRGSVRQGVNTARRENADWLCNILLGIRRWGGRRLRRARRERIKANAARRAANLWRPKPNGGDIQVGHDAPELFR